VDLVDRLEAAEQIRQLVARYAVAYDARDIAALTEIWAPDVRDSEMAAVKARLSPERTFHLVTTPALTFEGDDLVRGQAVLRAEAERGEQWVVVGGVYDDTYVRHGGSWYLGKRTFTVAYSGDVLSVPS
jgi:3-phenylpropionate/cinnamic acid dioxygenase small subunit